MQRWLKGGGLQFKGEREIVTGPQLLKRLQGKVTVVKVSFELWNGNGGTAEFSKIIPCVEDAEFEGKPFYTMFFDDNFKNTVKADPKEKNIAYPKDIYGRETHWDSPGIFGSDVTTVKAALRANYFVNKAIKKLEMKGLDKDRLDILRTYSECVGA